jgi:methylmalonyl-CoA mutase C-terminal domain/subunit
MPPLDDPSGLWGCQTPDGGRLPLDVQYETVVGKRHALRRWQLGRAVSQEDGTVGGRKCLLGGQMSSRYTVPVTVGESRFANEEVRSAREVGQFGRRCAVAGVGENLVTLLHAKAVSLELVVRQAMRGHLEARGLERRVGPVFVQLERLFEHAVVTPQGGKSRQIVDPAGRKPQSGAKAVLLRPVRVQPCPRNEVSPVVQMEVSDRDRVGRTPVLAQAAENTRATVEQQPPRSFEEVAGLGAPGVRPRRRGPDDGELHLHILADVARKIRVVIAKPGLDGHDRGAKIIARALRDAGMEVIYTGLHQTPEQIVETAIQEDADAVGISILSGAHMTLVPRILSGLKDNGVDGVLVVVGGTIPKPDVAELKKQGVAEVFTPGAPVSEIVTFLQEHVPVEA